MVKGAVGGEGRRGATAAAAAAFQRTWTWKGCGLCGNCAGVGKPEGGWKLTRGIAPGLDELCSCRN